jgi:hypothetical protein
MTKCSGVGNFSMARFLYFLATFKTVLDIKYIPGSHAPETVEILWC